LDDLSVSSLCGRMQWLNIPLGFRIDVRSVVDQTPDYRMISVQR
jgi:hypothetical protein